MARRERIEQERCEALAEVLRERLVERWRELALAGAMPDSPAEQVEALVAAEAALLSPGLRARLAEIIRRETVGLGRLEPLLADPTVEEVLVNGPERVWYGRGGRLIRSEIRFRDDAELGDLIERVLGPLGRRVDELHPIADGRLPDGSRVNVVIPPLAVDGPALSIRRFGAVRPGADELVERGTVPAKLMSMLGDAVASRRNILISGGTASGKTTLLNALSGFIPAGERLVTIEDAAELTLSRPHVVRLESRPASVEGSGEVTIRDLVRNALRMRPDRIIIGEVRGAEAMDLLMALTTGHRGALSTIHADDPAEALRRLEALALMAGLGVPHAVVRDQVAAAIDLVLQLERRPDGARVAVGLVRVSGADGEVERVWERDRGAGALHGAR